MSTRRKDYSFENNRRSASILSAILLFIVSYYLIFTNYKNLSFERIFAASFIITLLLYYFGVFGKFAIWLYPDKKQIKRN